MLKSESFQLRLTQPQMQRLAEVTRVTGLGKAEHIRRAVDYYLAGWRKESQTSELQPQSEPVRAPATPLVEPTPAPVSSRPAEVANFRGNRLVNRSAKVARR
jgi:hypothetical protein